MKLVNRVNSIILGAALATSGCIKPHVNIPNQVRDRSGVTVNIEKLDPEFYEVLGGINELQNAINWTDDGPRSASVSQGKL